MKHLLTIPVENTAAAQKAGKFIRRLAPDANDRRMIAK